MNTWWSALDTDHTSYEEIKHRKVIAQGWSAIGSLTSLVPLLSTDWNGFSKVIQILGDTAYGNKDWWKNIDRNENRAPTVMWNLLSIKKGDLIVAIKGIDVKGICQAGADGINSYQHQPAYEYAQTVSFPVKWVNWEQSVFGFVPTPPSRGVLGIVGLEKESKQVIEAWQKHLNNEANKAN